MKHNTHTERPLGGIVDIIPPPFRRRGLRVAATLLLRALLNLVGLAVLLPVLVLVLDVLLELCDRIVVLCGGQVSGVVDTRKTDKREVGALMTLVRGGNKDE